mgnify:CR=1 FL=1
MQLIDQGGAALRAEAGRLAAALRERRLWLALGVFAVLLLLAAQAPLDYRIDVGREEGYGGDLPLLSGFHDFERANGDTIDLRWTTGESTIRLPGLGPRAIQLIVRLLPVNASIVARMLGELGNAALLRAHRGRPGIDVAAFCRFATRLARLAGAPEIAELECNPVLATATGAIALDARIRLTESHDLEKR